MTMQREKTALQLVPIICLILIGFFLLLQRSFELGVQADEGVHVSTAYQVAQGQAIYRNLFENRTPAVEWLLAGFIRLGAEPLFTGRLLAISATLITAIALMTTTNLILKKQAAHLPQNVIDTAGFMTGVLFLLTPLNLFWSRFFMLEPFVTLAAALAGLCLATGWGRHNRSAWFSAGLWLGLAILFKQTAVVTTVAFTVSIVIFIILAPSKQIKQAKTMPLWTMAGLAIPLIGFVALLVAQGAFSDFLHLVSGADRIAPFEGIGSKLSVLLAWGKGQPLAPLALVSVLLILQQLGRTAVAPRLSLLAFPLIWFAAEISAVLLPPELDLNWGGFSHYILPTLAAGSLLAGVGIGLLWQLFSANRLGGMTTAVVVVLLIGLTLPKWWSDLKFVQVESDYPMLNLAAEQRAGAALASFVPEDQPVLIFGNAGFYYWANRTPAAKFFHYPGYFATSSIGQEVEAELLPIIREQQVEAMLVSRHHLDFRLTPTLTSAIWTGWEPVAIFPYAYQQDMLLFLPRETGAESADASLTTFGQIFELNQLALSQPLENSLFVHLIWNAQEPTNQPYTVFVHILRPDGSLVAQHDIQPGTGFRPTPSWRAGELINDYHWIELPAGENISSYDLSIGLYNSLTGERLATDDQQDSYHVAIQEAQLQEEQ
ncbi:MAG: hypothetical protein ACI9EW_002946 [Cellvibrionaceae bacterium]|jgi:hypothetical protein